jgi:arginase
VVAPGEAAERLEAALDRLRKRVADVYLHLDLDVLDPAEGRVNEYAAPGGLDAGAVAQVVAAVGERFAVRAAAVTAYDPAADPEGRIPATAAELLARVAAAAEVRMGAVPR